MWEDTGAAVGPPAADETRAYFLTRDHRVVAYDARSGTLLWAAQTGGYGAETYGFGGCVVAASVVACGDEDIVAFRRADGALAWRHTGTIARAPGYFPMTSFGGTVYAGSGSGAMAAIDGETGQVKWETQAVPNDSQDVNVHELSADNEIVVAGFQRYGNRRSGGLVAVDANSGQVLWTSDFPRYADSIAVGGESSALWQGLALGSSSNGRIHAVDRLTGVPVFVLPGVGTRVPFPGSPVLPMGQDSRLLLVQGNTLFANSFSGWVVAYDLTDQRELWRNGVPSSSNASRPASDGEYLYTVSFGGDLYAYSIASGEEAGRFMRGLFLSSPVVVADQLFFSAVKGYWSLRR